MQDLSHLKTFLILPDGTEIETVQTTRWRYDPPSTDRIDVTTHDGPVHRFLPSFRTQGEIEIDVVIGEVRPSLIKRLLQQDRIVVDVAVSGTVIEFDAILTDCEPIANGTKLSLKGTGVPRQLDPFVVAVQRAARIGKQMGIVSDAA